MADAKPAKDTDTLAIEPVTFDELTETLADDLEADADKLLRASGDSESLAREVERQLGSNDGS